MVGPGRVTAVRRVVWVLRPAQSNRRAVVARGSEPLRLVLLDLPPARAPGAGCGGGDQDVSGTNARMRALLAALQADDRRSARHGGETPAAAFGKPAEAQPGAVINISVRPDEHARVLAAEKGEAVPCNLLHDTGLADWARATKRLVRIDRKPWRPPLRVPQDGSPDAVAEWYAQHYLPFRPSLLRQLPHLRGKVLAFEGRMSGAHAGALAAAVDAGRR